MPAPRLGMLIPQFPGQTHVFFWREIAALEAMGVEVALVSTRPPPEGLVAHRWSEAAAARTHYLGAPKAGALAAALPRLPWAELGASLRADGAPFARDLALCTSAARQLVAHCREHGVAHVHAHSCGRAALVAALARRMGGPSYSLTLHGPLQDYGPGQAFKWRGAAFATVITNGLAAELRDALGPDLPERLFVRPMGVDVAAFARPSPYAPPAPDEPLRIFACGRLNIVKGHQHLLQAVRLLRDAGRDVELAIAGEDDEGGTGYRKLLEARIEELGLGDCATLLGAVDEGEVKRRLWEAHVFVLASFHEPLGVAYMEAMAAGVPVIGTDAGGVRELVTDGADGLLVPPKAPEALARAIARLADDPELARRLAAAGLARVTEGFDSRLGAELLRDELLRLC